MNESWSPVDCNGITPNSSHVLFIHGIGEIGGAETDLLSIIQGLNPKQFQAIVACPANSPLGERLRSIKVTVCDIHIPSWRKPLQRFRVPFVVFSLIRIIRRWNIHVVHVNDYWWAPFGCMSARFCQIPCVVHIRQQIEPKRIRQYGLTKPQLLLPVSKNIQDVALQAGVDSCQVQVVYSGIDFSQVKMVAQNKDVRGTYGLSSNHLIIGTVANLFPRKGIHFLLEALETIHPQIPLLHCLIVGDGDPEYRGMLEAMVEAKGLRSTVTFTGFQDKVFEYMMAIDVFVLPSTLEGFGKVLLEAMASSKPIVATRVGGIPEVVEEGITGLLVPSENSQQLAEALRTLLENPTLRVTMGQAGKHRVETTFSFQHTIDTIQASYNLVLSR